ncbi:hypothetical protein BCT52_02955 [Vibrio breoganii]|nr:hypothetical protein BCT52_02955 [Vibrio breoganii]
MLKIKKFEHCNEVSSLKIPIVLYMILIALSPLLTFKTAFMSSFIVAAAELTIILYFTSVHFEHFRFNIKNKEVKLLFLFLLSTLISNLLMILNEEILIVEFTLALIREFFLFVHVIFSVVLVRKIFIKYELSYVLVILPLVVVIYAIGLTTYHNMGYEEFLNNDYLGLPLVQNRRFLGYVVLISSIISSCKLLIFSERINKKIIIALIITTINLSFLFWLGGRGAIVAYFIAIIGFSFIQRLTITNKITCKGGATFIISLVLSIIISDLVSVYNWNGLLRFSFDVGEESLNQYSSSRISMWLGSLDYIYAKPWFGYGSDAYLILGITPHYHPHNFIIQIMLEFGFVGFILFMLLYMLLIIKGLHFIIKGESTIQHDISIFVVIALFTNGLLDGTIYHAVPIMFLSIFSSYLYFERNKSELLT